ncbi:MAG: chemotaxis protein CheZ [Rhodospirillales bacterium]|nr:chemotaxis protein CheZ [Rhodospirillales bacterium]MBT4039433.1 chemotaxis protein CheZ [Rhodospirillales bacterium]MBT4626575.1 chemotaxis protein CheZ [Rhodospirillales bacterium]MBT5352433.1 chemotaxis protein CheZ [Rhodospirillales bacterium]MBT5520447.1 chemotaxis protein CheZ [Rhodospirillales bacterium]
MGSMQGELTATDIQLYLELESLAAFIDSAKLDIAALRPDEVTDDYIPTATDELDAIVNATAEATNRIMDYAEIIEGVVDEVSPEVADKLMESTTNIFEACGFQDITGQRITKVVNALKDIDDKVNRLVEAFGTEIDRYKSALPETESVEDKAPTDEELLSGPQLENKAQSQEDIDALLASFD